MIKRIIMIVIYFLYSQALYAEKSSEKISLQLQYLDQFQFAGYYMAKERGFYDEVGLDVEIKPYKIGLIPRDEVLAGRANYGVGRSSLLVDISKGEPLVLLAAIFQSSPQILLTTKASKIETLQDIKGKRVMITHDSLEGVTLQAMLNSQGIYNRDFLTIKHDYNLQNLIDGKVDVMSAYISNEPFTLEKIGVQPVIFNPKAYGFDFYEDIIFTTKDEVQKHPKRVKAFLQATLRGWEYAFSHIDESVDLILTKYNGQKKSKEALLFEAKVLKELAYEGDVVSIGEMQKDKWQRIYDIYRVLGIINGALNIEKMLYQTQHNKFILSDNERAYLAQKKYISMCVNPNLMPYEGLVRGKYRGIASDMVTIIEKKIGVPMTLVKTQSWDESIEFVKKGVCDILPLVLQRPVHSEFLHLTKPYMETSYVVATTNDKSFLENENELNGKKIAFVKGYGVGEILKQHHKNVVFVESDSIKSALEMVISGKVFGYIDSAMVIRYAIEKYHYHDSVRISAKLDEKLKISAAVNEDNPSLFSIISKAFLTVSQREKETIIDNQMNAFHQIYRDYSLVWKLFILFSIILMVVLWAYRTLSVAKKKLEESVTNFEVLLNSTRDIIVVYDKNLDILLANKAGLETFGYTQEEISCLNVRDFIEENSEEIVKLIQEFNTNVTFEVDLYKKDKTLVPCLASGKNIIYNGKFARVSILTNLTEVKKAQQTLLEMNQSLKEQVALEVENSRQKDRQMIEQSRLAQMGEMISMIAHQWRQPLGAIAATGIDMHMSLMMGKYDLADEKQRNDYYIYMEKELVNIEKFVQNLTETIDDFRNFYKPNKERETLSINVPFEKSYDILKGTLDARGVKVTKVLKSQKTLALFNNELMQVFLNILKNALDNFKEKEIENPSIMIESQDTDKGIMIRLCDNGGGIDTKVITKIFDPYFSTKSEKNGTGLGLYMSKTIVEEHHKGKISVKNSHQGACFTIEIEV